MLSSTSNSNIRLPRGDWGRTWAAAGLILLFLLISMESFWRLLGFAPGFNDDAGLWAHQRRKVKNEDPEQVVLLGASRMQLGIDVREFHRFFSGKTPVQLSINGTSALPVLEHFARERGFTGTIICSATYWQYKSCDPENDDARALEYIGYYRSAGISDSLDRTLKGVFQKRLVTLLPDLSPASIVKTIMDGRMPEPPYIRVLPDRSIEADYTATDLERVRQKRIKRFKRNTEVSRECFIKSIDRIEDAVSRIQDRGGKVVFVRLPTSGKLREMENLAFPREKFWDKWAEQSSAIMINFEDYPQLCDFTCPDYSHLDRKDKMEFSRRLAKIIADRIGEQAD